MSIRYKIQKIGKPGDPAAPKKFYLMARSRGNVDRKDFIEQMVLNTSLTSNEAATALNYLLEALPRLLKMGFTVRLGEFGYFKTTIRSTGSDLEKDVSLKNLRDVRIRFVCGKALRNEIGKASLEKEVE